VVLFLVQEAGRITLIRQHAYTLFPLTYFMVFCVYMKRSSYRYVLVLVLFFVALFLYDTAHPFSDDTELEIHFLSVGQGDAIFIEAPNGVQMLIDGGPDETVLARLGEVMSPTDRSIDIVLATHPDLDHIGGLPEVLSRFDVSYVMDTGVSSDNGIYQSYLLAKQKNGIEYVKAFSGQVIVLDEIRGVYLEVLFPSLDRDIPKDINDTSVVLRLVYGEDTLLLTGDASSRVEKYLVSSLGEGLDSDILKLGHHGSKTSTSEEFVDVVSPDGIVISAGKDNRYGHPHKEVLSVLDRYNPLSMYDTREGTVSLVFDGKE